MISGERSFEMEIAVALLLLFALVFSTAGIGLGLAMKLRGHRGWRRVVAISSAVAIPAWVIFTLAAWIIYEVAKGMAEGDYLPPGEQHDAR
jgi:4-amino-4-deoxy-L-arabinose transferase-like glycosyltransferase